MTLCQDCQKITLTNLNHGTHPRPYRRSLLCLSSYAVLKPSARALSDSADNGCPLCAKFWDNLSRQGTQTTELLTALTDGRWPGEEEGEQNPRVIISWHYMKDETDWLFNGNTYISCGKWGMYCNPSSPLPGMFVEALLIEGSFGKIASRNCSTKKMTPNQNQEAKLRPCIGVMITLVQTSIWNWQNSGCRIASRVMKIVPSLSSARHMNSFLVESSMLTTRKNLTCSMWVLIYNAMTT